MLLSFNNKLSNLIKRWFIVNKVARTMFLRSGRIVGNDIIDFDEASREWRKNKISIDYGEFRYLNK